VKERASTSGKCCGKKALRRQTKRVWTTPLIMPSGGEFCPRVLAQTFADMNRSRTQCELGHTRFGNHQEKDPGQAFGITYFNLKEAGTCSGGHAEKRVIKTPTSCGTRLAQEDEKDPTRRNRERHVDRSLSEHKPRRCLSRAR